ncbi:MAG: histidine kinase, partial [Bacteroidota bacterium]
QMSLRLLAEIIGLLILPLAGSVYLHFWSFDRLFLKGKFWQYGIALIAILGGATGFQVWVEEASPMIATSPTQHLLNQTVLLILTLGLRYLKRGTISQIQLQRLNRENTEMELKALKAQLNPHFLFNTLNNIYALNQINAGKGSEMMLELSEVMRYHLQSSQLAKIDLVDEIQLIESYVELEKLRLSENCEVRVEIEAVQAGTTIAPLLILPFLENAFKHGTHSQLPCFVEISIYPQEKHLHVSIRNSIIRNKRVVKNHLGIENTVRRLELIYPGRYVLEIQPDEDVFEVTLVLPI